MGLLSIDLLGPPQISLASEPVRLGRRKALALLAYLAANPVIHQRDSLATLLWPESDRTSARANLRRTLSELKRQLDHDHFETDRESVCLCMDAGVEVDLARFHQLLSRGLCRWQNGVGSEASGGLTDLAAAVDLVRGPFLEGFSLADSVLFDDWQMFQTEAIRRDVMNALSSLTRGCQASGNPDRAIEFAYRWVALDPFSGRRTGP